VSEIWLMNPDGGKPKPLTEKSGGAMWLRWSPDGKRIAFVSAKSGTDNIYSVDTETGRVTQLTNEKFRCGEPAWSPDGKKLAYSSFPEEGRWRTNLIDPDSKGQQDVTGNEGGTGAAWSPDGTQIAFTSLRGEKGYRLYTVSTDGKDVRDLSSVPAPVLVAVPQWSPDGKTIVFTEWNADEEKMQITTVGADGKMLKVLTTKEPHAHPRWSPDGKSLSYGRFKDKYAHFDDDDPAVLIVSDADGKNPRELIRSYRIAEWKPR
jgi:TolB protein